MAKKKWILGVLQFILLISGAGITYSEEGRNFKSRLSIKLTGNFGYLAVGDINKCLKSFNNNDVFEHTRNYFPERVRGEITALSNWLSDWEAELRIDISPKIGLSLSTSSAFQRNNESSLEHIIIGWAGPQTSTYTYRPEVKVEMPVKLNFYYKFRSKQNADIFYSAGIGYYSGKEKEYFKYEIITPDGGYGWSSRYWETDRKYSLGFHGGVGIELSFTKNLVFVAEVQGKYVRIKNFKGRAVYEAGTPLEYFEETGTLYYYTMYDLGIGARHADLVVWENPPEQSIYDILDVRKAVLDLSGLSLRIGMRIKLF